MSQIITDDGYIHTFDKNGRNCWDNTIAARVVLVKDLRSYGNNLHIGQLGWTIPGTTDGYKSIEIELDSGFRLPVRLPLGVSPISRVVPEKAEEISKSLVQKYRKTRFDADFETAAKCQQEWMHHNYGQYVSLSEMVVMGEGDQELYAFTFPSLRELAIIKGQVHFPVKIGFSNENNAGAIGRVRQQITEAAAYPERPVLLLIHKTWDGRNLEIQVHQRFRELNRKLATSLGIEWFLTNQSELIEILQECTHAKRPIGRPAQGFDETLEEGINNLHAQGATVEFSMDRKTASVRMCVKHSKPDFDSP